MEAINSHYELYRSSVKADVLPGFKQFCMDMPTKNKKQWPTVESYLKHVINCIKISKKSATYEQWVSTHKETMLAVLCKIVEELCKEVDEPNEKVVLDLAYNHSMKYLKFSNVTMEFEGFTVIPRYTRKFFNPSSTEVLYLDADELGMILKIGDSKAAKMALEQKKRSVQEGPEFGCRHTKLFQWAKGRFQEVYLDRANTPQMVHDWVLPLSSREGFLEN
jgi:hypothetical protein